MIQAGTLAEATYSRFDAGDGAFVDRRNVIVSGLGAPPQPNAFLVHQSPNYSIRPHFHHNAQFQVVVAGSGTLGGHPVRPFTVHYSGQHTGYGPIVAGPDGLWYFTLRPAMEAGAWFLPESAKARDPVIRKTQTTAPTQDPESDDARRLRRSAETIVMIPPQADGLAAWMLRVPAGQAVRLPAHDGGGGAFALVGSGTMRAGVRLFARHDCLWIDREDGDAFTARAGTDGLDLLYLQFPRNAWLHTTQPRAPDDSLVPAFDMRKVPR